MKWTVVYSSEAQKDFKKLAAGGVEKKALALIEILKANPYQAPPPFKKLSGDMDGLYSRRINIQHRLLYTVHPEHRKVVVHRMWSHYGD